VNKYNGSLKDAGQLKFARDWWYSL